MDVVIGILGETVLRIDGRLVADWGRPKERAVLAALAIQPGRSVSVESLCDWIWMAGDEPENPSAALHTHVGRVRNSLKKVESPIEIVSEHHAYRLVVERRLIDYFASADRMSLARKVGGRGDHGEACAIAREALSLWRGTPLLELDGDRARNWRRSVFENEWIPDNAALIGALIERGDVTEALARLNELDRDHGDQLPLAKLRLRAYYQLGRVQDARTYHTAFCQRMRANLQDDAAEEIHRYHEELTRSLAPRRGRPVHSRLDQLPNSVPDFTGRHDLLAELDAALAGSARVVFLGGAGGVGKTTLAVTWARKRWFPDGNLYVDMNGFGRGPKLGVDEVVNSFLGAMGVSAAALPDAQARAVRLRRLMSGLHMLVLLDNVADSAALRTLLPLLGPSMVIVTGRRRLAGLALAVGARMITVNPLSPEQSVALLANRSGRRTAESAIEQLAALCEGIPLALNVVGDHVAARPDVPLDEFVRRLRGATLLRLGGDGDASTSLERVFEMSYSALSAGGQRLFRLLGLYPGVVFGAAAAYALAGGDVECSLNELVDAHLLDQRGRLDRFQFHDLMRGYAATLAAAEDFAADRAAAEKRLLSYFLHSAIAAFREVFSYDVGVPPLAVEPGVVVESFVDAKSAIEWFEMEHSGLAELARNAHDREYWRLSQVVAPPFVRFGWLTDARDAWNAGVALAAQTGDAYAEGAAANNLGSFYVHVGDYQAARPWLEIGLRHAEQIGLDYGIGAAQHNLARVEAALDRPWVALDLFGHALESARRAGNRNLQAATMHRLGTTNRAIGNYALAAKWLYQALFLREECGDTHGQGETLTELGALLSERGDHTSALAHLEHAVRALEEINDLAGAREARMQLAQVQMGLGSIDAALVHVERAVELARATWHREHEARSLDLLGQVRSALGDAAGAAKAWRAAVEIYADRGDPRERILRARLDGLDGVA
jgi:DNA-binding SARP family transcriptional activator/Tfp pilus assembly protein PilF